MPIENERKFVLNISPNLERKIAKLSDLVFNIEQSYVVRNKSLTVRIRKNCGHKPRYLFTVKQRVGDKVVEIEKKISESDYLILS